MKAWQTLRTGGLVTVEGENFKMSPGDIEPGDWYIAERNTGPKLLTAKRIDHTLGCIHSEEVAYSFQIGESVKVDLVPERNDDA